MEELENMLETMPWQLPLILILIIWEVTWKAIAMWKSARKNELGWFIAIVIINSAGVLPIIYLLLNKKKKV